MARIGSFQGPSFVIGVPLSIIHPRNNKFPDIYVDALTDPRLGLTDKQKRDLQQQIDEVFGLLREARDNASTYGF